MIILDEQLLGRNIAVEIGRWYQGPVRFIIELRPHTVIKDDAIPGLLRQKNSPTFVTINESDFWQRVPGDSNYCVVCLTLSDSRAYEIPQVLKTLFHHAEFNTKAKRMGKVIRVSEKEIRYYTSHAKTITIIPKSDAL